MTPQCRISTCRELARDSQVPGLETTGPVRMWCTAHRAEWLGSPEASRLRAARAEGRITQSMVVSALSDWRTRYERELASGCDGQVLEARARCAPTSSPTTEGSTPPADGEARPRTQQGKRGVPSVGGRRSSGGGAP